MGPSILSILERVYLVCHLRFKIFLFPAGTMRKMKRSHPLQLLYRGQIAASEYEIWKRAEIASTKDKKCADEFGIDHKV